MFNNYEKDLLTSLIVGDGNLFKTETSAIISIGHGATQKDYLEWKLQLLNNLHLFEKPVLIHSRMITFKDKKFLQYYISKSSVYFNEIHALLYSNGKISIDNMLNHIISDMGVAIWFMDDGCALKSHRKLKDGSYSICRPALKLCTHCFTYEENVIIADWFKKKYNVDTTIYTDVKKNRVGQPVYYFLKFNVENTENIYRIIKPYITCCDSMVNKFNCLLSYYK